MKSYIWTAVISLLTGGAGGGYLVKRYYAKTIEAGKNALAVIEGGIGKVKAEVKKVGL